VEQIVGMLKPAGVGVPVTEVIRWEGISERKVQSERSCMRDRR
jgi:hypothetical protein